MKRKVRTTIKHEQPPLSEEDIKNLPQHMLDKIPAGAALKPSAATLHRMIMQRDAAANWRQFAPMYNPMPFYTQQQQQATNMKNDNDIKEQAVNQAKQDIINEQERKRKLAQQDAANKREAAKEEHNIKMERQELDQSVRLQEQRQNLERQHQELNFRKQLLDKDNEISQLNMQKDDMEAINRELEHQIEMKRKQSNIEEIKHKYTAVERQHTELQNEYDALLHTIDSFNSSPVKKKYKDLLTNNVKLQAENMMLEEIKNQKQQAFMESMKNKAFNNINYNLSMNTMKTQLNVAQAELAKQIEANENIKRKLKRKEYLHGKAEDIWQQQQEKELEAKQLEEREKQSKAELPSEEAIKVAKKDIENQQKETQINANIELQKKIVEGKVADGKFEYLMSPESQAIMEAIAALENANEVEEHRKNEVLKTATLWRDAMQQKLTNEAKRDITNALLDGRMPEEEAWDKVSSNLSQIEQNVRLKAAADEYEHANQAIDYLKRLHDRIMDVFNGDTENSEALQKYIAEKNYKIENLGVEGLTEFIMRFKKDTGIDLLMPHKA